MLPVDSRCCAGYPRSAADVFDAMQTFEEYRPRSNARKDIQGPILVNQIKIRDQVFSSLQLAPEFQSVTRFSTLPVATTPANRLQQFLHLAC